MPGVRRAAPEWHGALGRAAAAQHVRAHADRSLQFQLLDGVGAFGLLSQVFVCLLFLSLSFSRCRRWNSETFPNRGACFRLYLHLHGLLLKYDWPSYPANRIHLRVSHLNPHSLVSNSNVAIHLVTQVLPIDEHEKAKLLPIKSARLRLQLVVYWIEQLNSNW